MEQYEETNAVEMDTQQAGDEAEKLFSQSDVDRILGERLAKEKAKHELAMKQYKAELALKDRIAEVNVQLSKLNIDSPELAKAWANLTDEDLTVNMDKLTAAIEAAVDKGVLDRIRPKEPPRSGPPNRPTSGIRQAMGLSKQE